MSGVEQGKPAEENVLVRRHGRISIITINRPHVRNAADAATSYAVDAALNEAEADDSVAAIILTGAGDKAFCSGMDLKEAARIGSGKGLVPGRGFLGITERPFLSKPLIAAVNGAAVAGGLEISLACDLVVAGETAYFGVPEVKRGLVPFAGGVQRLAHAIPRAAAMDFILTGAVYPARRMYELGLVSHVVAPEQVLDKAIEVAESIIVNSLQNVRFAKQLFNISRDTNVQEALRIGREMGEEVFANPASVEGVRAFAEKRDAKFDN